MAKDIVSKVSAGGVVHHKGKYLMVSWASEKTIELPKGSIEQNESPEAACIREVKEETGYNVNIITPLTISNFTIEWHDGRTIDKTVHYFLLELADENNPTPSREDNEDFESIWLSSGEAYSALSFDDMKVALKKAVDIVEGIT